MEPETRMDVAAVVVRLDPLYRDILYLWAIGHTQQQIGDRVGLAQQRVSERLDSAKWEMQRLLT